MQYSQACQSPFPGRALRDSRSPPFVDARRQRARRAMTQWSRACRSESLPGILTAT